MFKKILFDLKIIDHIKYIIKNKHIVFLLILLIFSIYLRLLAMPSDWSGDITRDYLVGYHIAKYQEFPIVGHNASGINFYYPPYYFYFVSLLIRLNDSYEFVAIFFTIFNSLSVITIYFIGKLLFGRKIGLTSAWFYTFSTQMILIGSNTFSANVILPLFFIALLFFVKFINQEKKLFLYSALLLLIISGTVQYSPLLYIPLIMFFSILLKKITIYEFIFLTISLFLVFIILQIPLLFAFSINQILSSILNAQNISFSKDIFERFLNNMYIILTVGFNGKQAIVVFLLLLFLSLNLLNNHWKIKFLSGLIFLLSFIILLPLLASVKSGNIFEQYFTPSLPFVYLLCAYIITSVITSISNVFTRVGILILVTIAVKLIIGNYQELFLSSKQFYRKSIISNHVIADIKSLKKNCNFVDYDFLQTYTYSGGETDMHRTVLWYYLERDLKTKIITVTNSGMNLTPINKPKFVYLLCEAYGLEKVNLNLCVIQFKKNYPHAFQAKLIFNDHKHYILRYNNDVRNINCSIPNQL